MTEEAKKRILERYSKATILEAYLALSEKHSGVTGKSVADVFNENLLAAPDIPEEQVTDDLCKAQAYQDYMEQLKQDGTETKNKDKPIVRIGSIDVNFYYGNYSFNPVDMKGGKE